MKKLLSLLLAISLCLSGVILLASCAGKSAYDVAVENGFTGTEAEWLDSLQGPTGKNGKDGKEGKEGPAGYDGLDAMNGLNEYEMAQQQIGFNKTVTEWLESLKGNDGKDGRDLSVTVNEEGYWVIDGVPTLTKVDGSKFIVTDIELVESTFTVVKPGSDIPEFKIKYTLQSGEQKIISIAESNMNPVVDFTKEGLQTTTITYAGFSKEVTVKIEGMMILYEDFNSLSNSATMAEILEATGFKIPTVGPDSIYEGYTDLNDNPIDLKTSVSWNEPNGVSLAKYTLPGYFARANFFDLKIDGGKMFFGFRKATDFLGGAASSTTDSSLILADSKYMALAGTGAFTVQLDYTFLADQASLKEDSKAQAIIFGIKNNITSARGTNFDGMPSIAGIGFAGASRISATIYRAYVAKDGKHLWYNGLNAGNEAAFLEYMSKEGTETASILDTLYPNDGLTSWGNGVNTITVRLVVKETTAEDWGFDLYIKKAGDPDTAFVKVGSYNKETVKASGATNFLDGETIIGLYHRGMHKRTGYYIDNLAVWSGNGDMPINIDTSEYEYLNDLYLASLPTETPAA